jgi:hypothetical protein
VAESEPDAGSKAKGRAWRGLISSFTGTARSTFSVRRTDEAALDQVADLRGSDRLGWRHRPRAPLHLYQGDRGWRSTTVCRCGDGRFAKATDAHSSPTRRPPWCRRRRPSSRAPAASQVPSQRTEPQPPRRSRPTGHLTAPL